MEQIVLIQMSDAHFEADLLNRRFGWIGGYRAHDVLLCLGFQTALRHVRQVTELTENEHPTLLLSGDLTATGMPGEFSAGDLFLRGQRPVDFDDPLSCIGLLLRPTQICTIPGNHDHWDGQTLPPGAYNHNIIGQHFQSTPWRLPIDSHPHKKLVLELFAIDSNSGMKHSATVVDRLRARGKIADEEFDDLEHLLKRRKEPSHQTVVRAITVHHPFSINARIPLLDAQPLNSKSRARLTSIASQYGISAVLNGHTHRFYFEGHTAGSHSHSAKFWEMRCASTFQGPAAAKNQGFLVHQLQLQDADKVVWRVWLYRWDGSRFVCSKDEPWFVIHVPAK